MKGLLLSLRTGCLKIIRNPSIFCFLPYIFLFPLFGVENTLYHHSVCRTPEESKKRPLEENDIATDLLRMMLLRCSESVTLDHVTSSRSIEVRTDAILFLVLEMRHFVVKHNYIMQANMTCGCNLV